MRDFQEKDSFDCVLMLQTSWGYFNDEENLHVLENVSISLKSGGYFVIDLVNPARFDLYPPDFKDCTAFDFDNNLMIDWLSFNKDTQRAKLKRIYIKEGIRKEAVLEMQSPTFDEMKNLLIGLDLEFVDVYGNSRGREFGNATTRMIIYCQKK